MATPRAIVLRSAGTNCEGEMVRAFELAGAAAGLVHVDALIADPARIDGFDLIGFPGGFSYGDDIAAGRVLAAKLRERLAPALRDAAERGVPMIGACNGFQVMVQAGLLPSVSEEAGGATVALVENDRGRFIDEWPGVSYPDSVCVWTQGLDGDADARTLPIAHGEGRFVAADPKTLDVLESNRQIAVTYSEDVNGSSKSIAGICDPSGRIFGLMPHPERFLEWRHHPYWTRLGSERTAGETIGLQIFKNGVRAVQTAAV